MSGPIPNHEIERVAHRICEELGMNPLEGITARRGAVMTRYEEREYVYSPVKREVHQLPRYLDQYGGVITPPPYEVAREHPYFLDEVINTHRWCTFRRDAEAAIAGWRAVHHYMLLET
jgi:hypothetical protein